MRFRATTASAILATQLLLISAPAFVRADEFTAGGSAASFNPNRRTRRVASDPKITTSTTTHDTIDREDQSGTGLALFVGAGMSYYSVQIQSTTTAETDKSGLGYQGKTGFNFFTRSLVLELAAGLMQSTVTSPTTTKVNGPTTTSHSSTVVTRAGILEFSPRFRLGSHFEFGPSGGVLFGTDTGFGEVNAQTASPLFAGVKAAMDWQGKDLHFRIIGQAQTSLTISDRRVLIGSIGLEIGLPLLRGKTVIRETQVREVEEHHDIEYVETEVPVEKRVEVVKEVVREVIKEVVLFSFDDQVVHFEFDHAGLTPGSREFVQRLGKFLAASPTLWSSLKIDGHTDNKGTPEYNLKLSEARAATVLGALAQAGVPMGKLTSKGMGLSSPIDRGPSDISSARNRRVELSFSDVSDAKALRDAINRIRFETTLPRTCENGHCR